MTGDNYRKWKC